MFYFLYNSYLSLLPQLSGLKAFEMSLHIPSNSIVIIKQPFSLFQSLHVILHKVSLFFFFWPAIFYVWQAFYTFKLQKGALEKKLSLEHCQYYLTSGINKQKEGYKVVQWQNGTHYQQFSSRNKLVPIIMLQIFQQPYRQLHWDQNKESNITLHWLFTFKHNLEIKHSLVR